MESKWNIEALESDVLIRTKDNTVTYLGGNSNKFNGFVSMVENEIQDVAIEFSLDSDFGLVKTAATKKVKKPIIRFKSTSFQKIKNNINFLKGNLTIKGITKTVELDAELINIEETSDKKRANFEVKMNIDKKAFGLDKNFNFSNKPIGFGKDVRLIANLGFSI